MSTLVKYLSIIGGIALLIFLFFRLEESKNEIPIQEQGILQDIFLEPATTSRLTPNAQASTSTSVKKVVPLPQAIPPKIEITQEVPPVAHSKTATTTVPKKTPENILPLLDEDAVMKAVVKIECPTDDGLGKYVGSGFLLKGNAVVTAAHVIMDSGSDICKIIFQRERKPIHYLSGTIDNLKEVRRRHNEEGIDVAVLKLPPIENYPEARSIFNQYPAIPYPVCNDSQMLGDKLLHFGYPSNYADQNYLSRLEGEAVVYADIQGIKEQLSADSSFTFKSPIFSYTSDESSMPPYMVSRVASFYGDSGGLAFNATKQCVIGPHRGGTIGKSAGENYSVFMNLGWVKNQLLDF